jgi:3-deoxy-D-manno-octulosonate 8-phosphate phosphatase (KDO 8-P phosphatase)
MTAEARAKNIKVLIFDVDGVLTDGLVYMHADGSETKAFDIRDGAAMVWAQRVGLTLGWLSSRASAATTQRAAQLAIRFVVQGAASKADAFQRMVREAGLAEDVAAYMGDDLIDLPVLARAGLSAAPADAAPEVRQRVAWISSARGGRGAVREFIEMILRAQHHWDHVVDEHLPSFDNAQGGPEALEGPEI